MQLLGDSSSPSLDLSRGILRYRETILRYQEELKKPGNLSIFSRNLRIVPEISGFDLTKKKGIHG